VKEANDSVCEVEKVCPRIDPPPLLSYALNVAQFGSNDADSLAPCKVLNSNVSNDVEIINMVDKCEAQ
jgi:hypothetical protein